MLRTGVKVRKSILTYVLPTVSKKYDLWIILVSMKVGERGQVTIPKEIRDRFGLGPDTEVEFHIVGGSIVVKKAPKKLDLQKWKGRCGDSFADLGSSSVDSFMDDVRGR